MKFKVIGSNKDTSARMVLEFEAESKAAAERKAMQQGMVVNSVQNITEGEPPHATEPRRSRGSDARSKSNLFPLLVVMVMLALVVFFFWDKIRSMIGK